MDTYTDRSRKYVQVGIGSVHIRTMPNTSSLSPEMVSALPSVPQKTVRSFMKVKHSVGVFRERGLTQRKGFVCRHRLIINSIAMVRVDMAFIACC
jgi:hypothetical protein